MTRTIDLMADVGEGFGAYSIGDDEALLDLLTSANVACGFHAGDPRVMERTVRACVDRDVAVGAHPGFADRVGFGRRPIAMTTEDVHADVLYQLGALAAIARAHGAELAHVTPHGSLGNLCTTDPVYARGMLDAVRAFDPQLPLVTQAGVLADLARTEGAPFAITAIADRAYLADGTLAPRRAPGAVIHDVDAVVERAVRMVTTGTVTAIDGSVVEIDCDTVLLHGDNPDALALAHRIRAALTVEGVTFAPLADVLALTRRSSG